jgi:chemotaxis protein CheD
MRRHFLYPGHWHFGAGMDVVDTLLGSCVSVVLWSRRWQTGGLCHFLLPEKFVVDSHDTPRPQGYFGDEALRLLSDAVAMVGLARSEFVAHVIGGGALSDSDPGQTGKDVGRRNFEFALAATRRLGFVGGSTDVGGRVYRRLRLDLRNGALAIHRGGLA